MAEVVHDELLFQQDAVDVDLFELGQRHDAGVAHQDVDGLVQAVRRGGARDDGVHVRELADQRRALSSSRTGDRCAGRFRLLQRAGGADHVGAGLGEGAQRLVTQTGVTAGDERSLARQVETGDDLVRRGREAVIAARDGGEGDGLARGGAAGQEGGQREG